MIDVHSFISGTLSTVDSVIEGFVNNTYINLVQENMTTITLAITLYVMFLGYQFMSHAHHFSLGQVIKQIVLLLVVYGLITNWSLYYVVVYNIFTNEPSHIAKTALVSADKLAVGENVVTVLDTTYQLIIDKAMGFYSQATMSMSGVVFLVYGSLVLLFCMPMCIYALILFVYSKMMLGVFLALGPIFILFLLWNSTRGMFSSWLSNLITLSLIPIITSFVLSLMLSVINNTLPSMSQPVDSLSFYGIMPFLGLSITTVVILSQVIKLSSSLGGGIFIAGVSTAADISGSVSSTVSQAKGMAESVYGAAKKVGHSHHRSK